MAEVTGVSDKPVLAPADYRALPPITKLPPSWPGEEQWVGSGVPLAQHPAGSAFPAACGACGSTDTLCIYLDSRADLVEHDWSWELECRRCGKFTQYSRWR